jgi:hypothetical protein
MSKKPTKLDEYLEGKKESQSGKVAYALRNLYLNLAQLRAVQMAKRRFFFWKTSGGVRMLKEFGPISLFVTVACLIGYKMEYRHRLLKKRIEYTTSFKEEKEKDEQAALAKIVEDPTNPYYTRKVQEVQRKRK